MCDRVKEAGCIWSGLHDLRHEDANELFTGPARFAFRASAEGERQYWAEQVLTQSRPAFDPHNPQLGFLGRYQPFCSRDRRLIEGRIAACGPSVHRRTRHLSHQRKKSCCHSFAVKQRMEAGLVDYVGLLSWYRFPILPKHFMVVMWDTT